MNRAAKPSPDATLGEALLFVAWHPVMWPAFLGLLARHGALKARFYWLCWSSGHSVRYVRRIAREYRAEENPASRTWEPI